MHHASRIFLCRTGFVLFCLLPTLVVGLWIVRRSSGDYASAQRDEWQRGLTSRLGLAVEIGEVSYPSYAVARLVDVRVLDPETGALIAQVPVVEVIPTTAGWQVEAWQPQIEAAHLGELARALNERLLRGPADALVPCELLARDLTLLAGPQSQTFAAVSCRLDPLASGPELTIAAGPMTLSIARNRQQSPPVTRWQFNTAGQSLPCASWPMRGRNWPGWAKTAGLRAAGNWLKPRPA